MLGTVKSLSDDKVVVEIEAIATGSYEKTLKGKFTLKSFGLVALCGIANGLTSFSQKLFVYSDKIADSGVFNLYTYIFSSAVLFISYLISKKKEKTDFIKDVVLVKDISFIVLIMAVCLFANSYFIVLAAKFEHSVVSWVMLVPYGQLS